ncbi:unnamed protein product [Paramecium pentaurelia]|uniref:Uncharacterized protein n=1 Tax=Paramecium pentaurelia TaxID=43138 RepID=A0A8S1UUW5_9CILI|nr:unnamed protein product [Paramecium pentaurelia]
MNNNKNQLIRDENKVQQLKTQAQIVNQYAATKKSQVYGIPFTVHIEKSKSDRITEYGLKTVQDLVNNINQIKKSKDINALPNFLAFESQESQNILSHSILLKDLKDVYMKELSSENMAYIHVFGKKNVCTYYVNKNLTTVDELIQQFNNDPDNKQCLIDVRADKYGIGSRLEPGMQINENIMKSLISIYVEEGEGLIRILPY